MKKSSTNNSLEDSQLMEAFSQRLKLIKTETLNQYDKQLDENQKAIVTQIANRFVQRILDHSQYKMQQQIERNNLHEYLKVVNLVFT